MDTDTDFYEASSRRLDRCLDHVAASEDGAEKRRCADMYKHLASKQREALIARTPEAREAFEREYLACAPAFGFGARREAGGGDEGEEGLSDGEEVPPPTAEQKEEFKRTVRTFFQVSDEERGLRRRAGELAAVRKRLEAAIVAFMRRFEIENVDTREGKLKCVTRNSRGAPSRTDMEDRIRCFFGEDLTAAEALRGNLFERKEAVEKVALRRVTPRPQAVGGGAA